MKTTTTWADVHSALPGPESMRLWEVRSKSVAGALASTVPAVIARAQGATLEDVDGNRFIDLASGVGVMLVGHSHPRVLAAVTNQAQQVTHLNFSVATSEPAIHLAAGLAAMVPGGPHRVAFFNSGAEAVENAVKIARVATGRSAVIGFEGAFHGRTYMAMSLTSRIHPYKEGFGPFMPEVYRMPYPYAYRLPNAPTPEEASAYCLNRLGEAFHSVVDPKTVAAIVVEPVLGEGGFVPAPPSFLRGLRELASQHGILLVVDEIQTGFGRTGTFLAMEPSGIRPDLVTLGKAIAAGFPLSAVVGRQEVMDSVPVGGIGGTYGGNAVACAAGLAVLDIIAEEDLVARAALLGGRMRTRFDGWVDRFACVGEARGVGAMQAVEFVEHKQSRLPNGTILSALAQGAMQRGVVTVAAGLHHNVLRMLPPLTIEEGALSEALDILEGVMTEAFARTVVP